MQYRDTLKNKVRKRYLLALTAIAILVTASATGIQFLLANQKGDAELINIAGMQRMLSQKIALHINQLVIGERNQEAENAKQKASLLAAIDRFEQNHWFLVGKEQSTEFAAHLSPSLKNLYFTEHGENNLHQEVLHYIEQARRAANQQGFDSALFLEGYTETLLQQLDQVVTQNEIESNQKLQVISRIEVLLWLVTLLVLALELFFIFRPMERQINNAFAQLAEEKQKAEELQLLAEQASKSKSLFLATMSHELRTPINGIFGMIELASNESEQQKRLEFLSKARVAGDQLLHLINDILDISKIEANKISLENNDFELPRVLDTCLAPAAINCEKKGLDFEYAPLSPLPEWVCGDGVRVTQILNNLISNAIKFTHQGKISATAKVSVIDKKYILEIVVSDTGIGMTKAQQEKVFDKFVQADSSTTRVFGGTGLGLAITKELVNLMNGSIELDSRPGEGTTFTVQIPLNKSKHSHTVSRQKAMTVHSRVAVVDDLESSRCYVELLLQQINIVCDTYASASEMLENVHKLPDYNVVLVDLHMPDMDGIKLVNKLKAQTEHHCPPFVLISAASDLRKHKEHISCEFAAVFNKPINESMFISTMRKLCGKEATETTPLKILLAEDNEINAQIAVHMLESEGHSVTHVDNGKKAVLQVERHQYDLVFMDINMPEMDGLTASKIIRFEMGLAIPIVALTANAYESDKQASWDAGMTYHLSKPFNKDAMTAVIGKIIDNDLVAQAS